MKCFSGKWQAWPPNSLWLDKCKDFLSCPLWSMFQPSQRGQMIKRGAGNDKKVLERRLWRGGEDALAGYLGDMRRTACCWLALEQNSKRPALPGNDTVRICWVSVVPLPLLFLLLFTGLYKIEFRIFFSSLGSCFPEDLSNLTSNPSPYTS